MDGGRRHICTVRVGLPSFNVFASFWNMRAIASVARRGEARRRKYSSKKKKMRNGSREIYKEDTIYSYVFSRAGQEQMTYLFLSGRCLNLHIQMQNWCFFNRIHINIQYSSIFHYWGFKWAGFITSMGGDIECLQGSGGETGHSEGRVTKEMITLR